jgi:hypothetical protein
VLQVKRKMLTSIMPKLFGLFVFMVIVLCCPNAAHAQGVCNGASPTWTAASASAQDVQACFNNTLHCDDTIIVPSGSSTWSSQVSFTAPTGCATNHGVTVQGATTCDGTPGVQVNTCTDNTNITLGSGGAFHIHGSSSGVAFVTGFTFIITVANAVTQCPIGVGAPHGQVGFRFHHNHIKNPIGGAPSVSTAGYGLIDHVLWDDTAQGTIPLNFFGDFATRGALNWTDPTNFGSNEAVYVEDSRENASSPSTEGFFDAYFGAKIVIRHNTIINNLMGGGHGTDSGGFRSVVLYEIYNNTLTNNTMGSQLIMNSRGGTLLFYNNTMSGSYNWGGVSLQYFRFSLPSDVTRWGTMNAGLNWIPESLSETPCVSGVGACNTLNAPDWQANHSYATLAAIGPLTNNSGRWNYQNQSGSSCTSGGAQPAWNQQVTDQAGANDVFTTDGTCTWTNVGGDTGPPAGTGAGFLASNPDTACSSGTNCTRYFDNNGGTYPFRDQPGTIHDQVVYGNYAWNNTVSGVPNTAVFSTDTPSAVQSGRDYFNNVVAPGYTPYVYPHPLNTSGSPPPALTPPTNMTAVVN